MQLYMNLVSFLKFLFFGFINIGNDHFLIE